MDFDFSWIIILLAIGIVSGTWGALIGAGGGFIIVPFLLIFLDNQNPPVPVSSITAISLAAVCINGISLTIAKVENKFFSISIIPHTFENTNLKYLKLNDIVNVEFDYLARFTKRLL